ncbi:inner centromere protein A-like [Argiope bruennichi]|uniref:Inner centromere protein like n=1 Tax=Argiope bruennichi TaxID=94029 RepID=A0A8T0F203_ARGBR|nr:inner centromere protein A-like [Argiope bruennichi]KAF8784365.1 Inner centromere protein like [Argiope bruennichi]
MSVATNSILKLLSDLSSSSDKIVEENASEFMLPRISEWISLVKNKARSIVESESVDSESGVVPSLMPFLKGSSKKGPRVSTVLTEIQKLHLHKRGKDNVKSRKSRRFSVKTPLQRKSDIKGTNETFFIRSENDTPKLKIPPPVTKIDGISYSQNVNSSASSSERKEETPLATFTPASGKSTSKIKDRNSKRKSSSELSLEKVKKSKVSIDEVNDLREREKSMQNSNVEELMKSKNSSLLPNNANIKSSVVANAVVLKENRVLRSKIETKQEKAVENRKNILALRQQKLQQNKRTREEKMEKTLQQRMKLEKEKLSKLRSGTRKKDCTNSNKEATPRAMHKIVAENETLGETSNSTKSKEKEKHTSVKKLQMNAKKTGTSVLKSNEKTPIKKNPKHETEKMMNVTYIATEQPTSNKGNFISETNIGTNSETLKGVSNDNKPQTHTKGIKTLSKTMKPLFEQQKQLANSTNSNTPMHRKGPESYAITPARSSFVSYDISEIRSDSEEEEQETSSKPIPPWATGVRLRNALLQQHHHPIDTDELFGNFFDPPDLALIMGIKKKHYNKRTSSAVWNSSFS